MPDHSPLLILLSQFFSEYRKFNDKEDKFLFYFEMSSETFASLVKLRELEYLYVTPEMNYCRFNIPNKKIIGRLYSNSDEMWQVPIVEENLPKGKVFLRKV